MSVIDEVVERNKNNHKNMELWDSVKETNPKWTKPGLNNLTSINGMYCAMRATEVFGPCGLGWGWDILEERYDEGALLKYSTSINKKIVDFEHNIITHTIKIKLWYRLGDQKGEIPHFGHTPFVMKSRWGPYQDDEAPKKSLTDAIKKCLSMLGIGADIHLGQFDDITYKQELELKSQQEEEKEQEDKEKTIKDNLSRYMVDARKTYEAATTVPAVNGLYKSDVSHIRRECKKLNIESQPMVDALTESATNRKGKLA